MLVWGCDYVAVRSQTQRVPHLFGEAMKHLLLILVLSLAVYFGWYYAEKPVKRLLKKLTKRHVIAVVSVFVVAFAALLVMFFNRAVNIL